jgi:hypothetical protein
MHFELNFEAFCRGYWDSVQFAYIPDYDSDGIKSWYAGLNWGRAGKGQPYTEQLDSGEITEWIESEYGEKLEE